MAPYGSQRNALQELRTNDPLPADPVDRQLGLEALVEKIDSYKSPNFDWAKKVFHRVDSETGAELRVAMKDHYLHAESQGLDFNNSTEASGVIDEWVETTTRDRTSNLVKSDDLTADVSAVLVNAVYFKGVWFRPFTPTGDDVFHVNSSKQIKIPFMRKLDFFEYGELPRVDAEFIRIPYEINGSENEISMFIILPKLVDGIAELERKIKKVKIAQLLRGKLQEILLSMPKFTIKNEISIDEPLKNAQFIDMFTSVTGRSQASNVSSQRLSKFVQKVVIEVDEKSGFRGINASPLPGTPKLSINHPFIFIVATTSGIPVILFTARYTGSDYENV
ncbi:antichymotrypsin-2-like [Venturia canescens]|uniref:antichymotrypsin-2-like n=1 Tax=Venturia canescens TaxID=32260 RepID=UPI001C9CA023|nr:antichymotrypsin-2-like [Venturia canescens]